jgi:hypothetical protein
LAPYRIWVPLAAVGTAWGLAVFWRLASLRIVGVCMAVLVAYAMVQDQVTVRLCPEYFTVGHPPIAGLTDPHRDMLVVANAHFGTYGSAVAGGVAVCVWVVRARRRPA